MSAVISPSRFLAYICARTQRPLHLHLQLKRRVSLSYVGHHRRRNNPERWFPDKKDRGVLSSAPALCRQSASPAGDQVTSVSPPSDMFESITKCDREEQRWRPTPNRSPSAQSRSSSHRRLRHTACPRECK